MCKINKYHILSSDMRKALSRDVKKKSMIPLTHPVRPEEVDWNVNTFMYNEKNKYQIVQSLQW